MTTAKTSRFAYIDNLRALCIILVVLQHAAVTYSGLGRWYYNEAPAKLDALSSLIFGLFQSHLQAFFMSMFFLISGYFVPAAIAKKGAKGFAKDRLLRLGIPLLVYVLVLHPLTVVLVHSDVTLAKYYLFGLVKLDVFSWTGPLWFVETLLIFSLLCLPFARFLRVGESGATGSVTAGRLWCTVAGIALVAFGIRLVYPIGTAVLNLQFCFFSAYLFAFALGVAAGCRRSFDAISLTSAKRWLGAAFGFGLPLWFVAVIVGGAAQGRTDINGGWNAGALLYAIWESFFCVAFIVALLGITREKFNFQKPWMHFLSDNTFAVYVFHTIVLVGLSLLLRALVLPPLLKFALVGTLAVAASFGVAWILRRVPLLRRWFA
jgi:peptidoglycan/LPS O-acetylase OafA/YrhL